MEMRNKLNEAENSHLDMFSKITDKLLDSEFITQASELASEREEELAANSSKPEGSHLLQTPVDDENDLQVGDCAEDKDEDCPCNPEPAYSMPRCADEGSSCYCPVGRIVFAVRYHNATDKTKSSTPSDALQQLYALTPLLNATADKEFANETKEAEGYKGSMKCHAKSFRGADPAPGQPKQCFCDATGQINEAEAKNVTIYWKNVRREKRLKEEAERAKAEAAAAAKRALEAARKAKEEAARAAEEARLAAIKQAQEEERRRKKAEAAAKAAAEKAAAEILRKKKEAEEQARKAAELERQRIEAEKEAARKAAEAAAAREKAEKERLRKEAEAKKQAAIKAAVDAALAAQKAAHGKAAADLRAEQERQRNAERKAAQEQMAAQAA